MNNPFYYEPHPLALQAVDEVVAFLKGDTAQRFLPAKVAKSFVHDISKGKMFGVLVVERKAESGEGQIGMALFPPFSTICSLMVTSNDMKPRLLALARRYIHWKILLNIAWLQGV